MSLLLSWPREDLAFLACPSSWPLLSGHSLIPTPFICHRFESFTVTSFLLPSPDLILQISTAFSSLGHLVWVNLHEAILPVGFVCLKRTLCGEEKGRGLGSGGPGFLPWINSRVLPMWLARSGPLLIPLKNEPFGGAVLQDFPPNLAFP